MIVYYASLSGNVRRFAKRLPAGFEIRDLKEHPRASEPFILLTYTFGFGQVPDAVRGWLEANSKHMIAVAASGNRNWGDSYAKAGDHIAERYGVPLLLKFELSGNADDTAEFTRKAIAIYDDLLKIKQ